MSDELEKLAFEEAFDELESTVQRLEVGEIKLEESIALYERGMLLAQHCDKLLDAAQRQITDVALSEGQQPEMPFDEV